MQSEVFHVLPTDGIVVLSPDRINEQLSNSDEWVKLVKESTFFIFNRLLNNSSVNSKIS